MNIKVIMLVMAVFVVALSGCVGTKPEITNSSSLIKITVPQNAFKTMIISDQYGDFVFSPTVITIVGRLDTIRYPGKNDIVYKDILIFEDGTIVSTYGAENFEWKPGKIHLVIIKDIEIKKVVVSE